MIRPKAWQRVPSTNVRSVLVELKWRPLGGRTPAAETAALVVYVALLFSSECVTEPVFLGVQYASVTYNELQEATGLSRAMIAAGLSRLTELRLIEFEGSQQKRSYKIVWADYGAKFFKLPVNAIVRSGKIIPFMALTMRSKYELHAMKLYLYLAAIRNNSLQYSMATYETIYQQIGIPEREIRKAINVLVTMNLLSVVDRKTDQANSYYGPNQYFLAGSEKFAHYPVESEALSDAVRKGTPSQNMV